MSGKDKWGDFQLPLNISWDIEFEIKAETVSKENSRQLVWNKNHKLIPIKSKKALSFVKAMSEQCPVLNNLLEDDLIIAAKIYYASRRPDLDESLLMDTMQGKIYKNDRQIKEKHIYWGLDRENPRALIKIKRRD